MSAPPFVHRLLASAAIVAACATHPVQSFSQQLHARGASALWSSTIAAGPHAVGVYENTVLVELYQASGHPEVRTEGLDALTGKILWQRDYATATLGGPPFLAVRNAVERINVRTGATRWRSSPLCKAPHAIPTNAMMTVGIVYAGCNDGEIFALQASTGRILASAQPIDVTTLDSLVPLAYGTLGVSGYQDISMVHRRAILKRETLSAVLALPPDVSYVAYRGDEMVAASTCCRGLHTDTWPATIQRYSLSTGKLLSSVDLHPQLPALPSEAQPGAGTVLLVGNHLYVATHSALFLYDLAHLSAPPRLVYGNLLGATLIDNRYFFLNEGTGGVASRVVLLDASARPAREAWTHSGAWLPQPWTPELGPTLEVTSTTHKRTAMVLRLRDMALFQIDSDCMLQTSNDRFAFTYCPSTDPARPPRLQMYALRP
jgi:hypothetical protein